MHAWISQGSIKLKADTFLFLFYYYCYYLYVEWTSHKLKYLLWKIPTVGIIFYSFYILNSNKSIFNENLMISWFNVDSSDEFNTWAFSHLLSGIQWRFEVLNYFLWNSWCT